MNINDLPTCSFKLPNIQSFNHHYWLGLLLCYLLASPFNTLIAAPSLYQREASINLENHPGEALYENYCAHCHDTGAAKAPPRELLETFSVAALSHAINDGIMREQASALNKAQKRQLVEFISAKDLSKYTPPPPPVMCTGKALAFDLNQAPYPVGWGYDNRRFVPAPIAQLNANDIPKLKLKWAFAFPEALRARSQPVVAMGAVFVGSQDGTVYAFDLETGCARWTSRVNAEVRTAIVVEPWQPNSPLTRAPRLFFGDLVGRVYALNALTGEKIWQQTPEPHAKAGITGSPRIHNDTLFVPISSHETSASGNPNYPCCDFRGSVVAMDTATGAIKWQHYTIPTQASEQAPSPQGVKRFGPAGAAVWNSPSYDSQRDTLYFGSGQSYAAPAEGNSDSVFAVNASNGKRLWQRQLTAGDIWGPSCILIPNSCKSAIKMDVDVAASVLLINGKNNEQVLVASQKSGMVTGLDPNQQGKVLWRNRLGGGSLFGGVHFGMASDGTTVYVPIADMPQQWDGKPSKTPLEPGLNAINALTGKTLWRTPATASKCDTHTGKFCDAGISSAITAIPGAVFAGHLDGMLRAYDGNTGKIIWQTDTTRPASTQNGLVAQGGSMSGPGPAIANGHLIVNSGYGFAFGQPGNALLVYSVDGK